MGLRHHETVDDDVDDTTKRLRGQQLSTGGVSGRRFWKKGVLPAEVRTGLETAYDPAEKRYGVPSRRGGYVVGLILGLIGMEKRNHRQ